MKIKQILISQPPPAENDKSPFKELTEKFGVKLTFRKFIKIEGVSARDFRKERINLLDYGGIIMTSRNAVDNYFRMAKEMRITIPSTMKYFCSSETTAFYLQNYVQYRKRKIFYPKQQKAEELVEIIIKHKTDKILFPCSCSDAIKPDIQKALEKNKIKYTKANIYQTVPDHIADEIDIKKYGMLVFFSPIGIQSLFENYPDFKQGKTVIAAFGSQTGAAVLDAGLRLDIPAPTPTAPSMAAAIEEYLTQQLKAAKK